MALGFDPQKLPVIGVDDHLPAVTEGELLIDALRRRFGTPPVWTPEIKAEHRFNERAPAHASVLVALVPRTEITVLLTQRTDHLTDHPGQISFPGGRVEPTDADAAATALREAHEEIGLEPSFVDVLGAMPTYTTGTGFIVTPVIGLVAATAFLMPDPIEVADVFEVPLAFLLDPANHKPGEAMWQGRMRHYHQIDWQGRRIWGATAAMVVNLSRRLAWPQK